MKERIRHLLLKFTPEFILVKLRDFLKERRRKSLQQAQLKQAGLTKEELVRDLRRAGVQIGDTLLVHCSMSKIGFIKGGASTLLQALEEAIGREGTLMMPAFPAEGRNLDYIQSHPFFDEVKTPSKMGLLSEMFRQLPETQRSIHPTDSICAKGINAAWIVSGHKGMQQPYGENSPFRRLCELKGKILMLGTTLNGACTNLHTLEDFEDGFLYPIYMPELYKVKVQLANGSIKEVSTRVHNPDYSAKRNADALKPLFLKEQALHDCKIGEAKSMLIDAARMLQVMVDAYKKSGVTMYTPKGGVLPE